MITLKPLTVWITTNCGNFLKRWESQTTLLAFWETCMQVKKQQLGPDMEQWTGSKLGKEYMKAVYCHPVYLISMQSSVQLLSHVLLFVTSWTTERQASLHRKLAEFTQTHVYWVGDAIQPSHPLLAPSPAFSLSQYQGLFQWVSSLHQFQLQHQFFQWTLRIDVPLDGLVGSPCSPRDSQESSPTPHFKGINSLVLSSLYSPILYAGQQRRHRLLDSIGEEEGGMIWENSIETYTLPYVN